MRKISRQQSTRRSRKTKFHYAPKHNKKQQRLLLVGVLVCVAVLTLGLYHIIRYAGENVSHHRQTAEIREAYYATAQQAVTEQPLPPAQTPPVASVASVAQTPAPEQPAPTPRSGMLPLVHYPNNFNAKVRDRFQVLRLRYSGDIMGWLKIGTKLDEPVVQKDNTYYLRRDYEGNTNSNGTLFLDESIEWKTRPYTLMIYGHNMKSGAMFGHLKSFEKHDYFVDHALITFDNAYEDGRYVVFAVGTYSLQSTEAHFLNLGQLDSRNIASREKQIRRIRENAVLQATGVDVQAEDQLLLLITCVDDDNERRILAARRVRDNETEEQLKQQVRGSFPE